MKESKFQEIMNNIKQYREKLSDAHDTYWQLRDLYYGLEKEFQSYEDSDWKLEGSKDALNKQAKENLISFLKDNQKMCLSEIINGFDLSSVRVTDDKVVSSNETPKDYGNSRFNMTGGEFFDELAELEKKYSVLSNLPSRNLESICEKMAKSFGYECAHERKNPCDGCDAVSTLLQFVNYAQKTKEIIAFFYRKEEKALEDEYDIIEWSEGKSAKTLDQWKLDWPSHPFTKFDKFKILALKNGAFPKTKDITYEIKSGVLIASVEISEENQLSELYRLLESAKCVKYEKDAPNELRRDLTSLLELVHYKEYLDGLNVTTPIKYSKRCAFNKENRTIEKLTEMSDNVKEEKAKVEKAISLLRSNLCENYGILSVKFACEDKEYYDGPSMFRRCPNGVIKFNKKEFTDKNDMKLIKAAKDYIASLTQY